MILRWSVLRRAIRTLHRRQNVPASWENIELSHIHIHIIYVLAAGSCFWIVHNQMHLSGYDVQFGFCKALAPRSGVCFQSLRFVWTEYRLLKAKWCGLTQFIEIRYFAPGVFLCKSSLGGVAWCCFQHEDLQNLSNSVQLIVTRIPISFIPWQCNLHGMEFPWNPWNLGNSSDP